MNDYYVYVIRSKKNNRIYVGISPDTDKRLKNITQDISLQLNPGYPGNSYIKSLLDIEN
ncbi:MAG: GIY-YIG nuclease family protein [Patescibacteria group bacterium]|nr:GIY-YIG nuclease family protein [Patescibacteria group bacterium]